jgi:hypothetical protein
MRWISLFLLLIGSGCSSPDQPGPDVETVRAQMTLLKVAMHRAEVEKVLGLRQARVKFDTNLGTTRKYLLQSGKSVFCTYFQDELQEVKLDFGSITSRVQQLRRWISYPEFETTLGIRMFGKGSGSSSSVHITYEFEDPENTNSSYAELRASFTTSCALTVGNVLEQGALESCLRNDSALHSLLINSKYFELPDPKK